MNRNLILGGVAALALGAVAGGVAVAQQAPDRPQAAERVSRADFVEQRVARVTALDTNRDGTVAPEERRAARDARRAERLADRFAKLDTNADGSLSRAEFEAGHAMRGERMGRRGPGGPRPERVDRAERTMTVADARTRAESAFERLDKDRDGYVTREERHEGRRGHRGPGRGPAGMAPPPPAPGS